MSQDGGCLMGGLRTRRLLGRMKVVLTMNMCGQIPYVDRLIQIIEIKIGPYYNGANFNGA